MKESKMFNFGNGRLITWNPIRMKRCPNECYNNNGKTGCYANQLREGKLKALYEKMPVFLQYISSKRIQRWKENYEGIVFVGSMCDMFLPAVPTAYLSQVMNTIRANPKTTFLPVTKHPTRYLELLKENNFFPPNLIFGITIESNRDYPKLSHGEPQSKRIAAAVLLSELGFKVFISIEPILNFDPVEFTRYLKEIKPWGVAIGYDNYDNCLPEPSIEKTLKLIETIKEFTPLHKKTLREKHGN